jgi:hypothetical protein
VNHSLLLLIVGLVVVGLIALSCLRLFFAARIESFRQRLFASFHASATIVLARVTALSGGFLVILANGADLLGAPGVRDAVQGVVPPNVWPYLMIVIAVATEAARRRTLTAPSDQSGAA